MEQHKIAVVTGGAGFIGSHMVDLLLKEGFQVRVLDNLVGGRLDNLAHHRGNQHLSVEIRDIVEVQPNDSLFHQADYVFHFAGIGDIVPSIERPRDYMRTNVQGTVAALEGARYRGGEVRLRGLVVVLRHLHRIADHGERPDFAGVSLRPEQVPG